MQSIKDVIKHIPWVVGRPDGYYFLADPLLIDAPPATVWELVKNVGEYHHYSHETILASLPQGELKVGNTIHLVLYPHACVGNIIPASDERISVVDDEHHILAWERATPFGGSTECYRVLESVDDGRKTASYIALKIPGSVGFFTSHLLKAKIEAAFNRVNQGIKEEAEQARHSQAGCRH